MSWKKDWKAGFTIIYSKEYGREEFDHDQWAQVGFKERTRHRIDGPAISHTIFEGKRFYIDGKCLTFKQWFIQTNQPRESLSTWLLDPASEIREEAKELYNC